jgi:dipeptidyl aminopeptidase/acylaminoacyl peptidase
VGGEAQSNPPKIDEILKQLEKTQAYSGVSISPDGRWVTWTQAAASGSRDTEIYLLDRKDSAAKARRITAGDGQSAFEENAVAWSPDSSQIAFLSNAGSSQLQVMVAPAAGGPVRRLSNLTGHVRDPRWSPDGKRIAFLHAENGGGGGPLEAVPARTGAIASVVHNQRLAVIDVETAAMHEISPSELNIYEYDWSPDGKRFAAIAAPGPADDNWWVAELYLVDAASGKMKLLYKPERERQLAVPRWSPDGKQVAFIGGLTSDEGFLGGDIFAAPAQGGDPRNLTPDIKSSPNGFRWQGDHEILFTETVEGGGALAKLDVAGGRTEMVWKGSETLHQDGNFPNLALAKDGTTSVAIRSSWERAPEIWAGPIGQWEQVTHANAEQWPYWGKSESVNWLSDGFRVQGWLLYPQHFDAAKRYPMVVEIHGGPAGMRGSGWPGTHFDLSVMAGLGYFVFFPNPRGSTGSGEAFTRANVKDFGGGDLRDVLAGVDEVLRRAPVDGNRVGVAGWSYGGFMTMWAATQSQRFRAAVAGAGIANWQSYYGQNSIDKWMIPYFGASVYDDPAVYAKSSPIMFIKQAKTPTLVVVGERDGECPAPQSFEFWHALKTLGVPSELVVYAGEGHSFSEAKDRLDVLRRSVNWFNQYLQAPHATAAEQLKQQEKQRILGFIPEFNTSNVSDAERLSRKQKMHLAFKSATDPFTFLTAGIDAGLSQSSDSHAAYGQGMQGYAKRFAASYADSFDGTMIGNGILPVLLHQDPRYFRKGSGSFKSRFVYSVLSTVRARNDDGQWRPNYSNLLGNLAAGGISNLYYPEADRGVGLTFGRAAVVSAEGALGAFLYEFWPDVSRKLAKKKKS